MANETPNYGFNRPTFNTSTWHNDVNANFTSIDSLLGSTSVGLNYTFSTTTTMANPGIKNLRFNHVSPASVTAIAISDTDNNSVDMSAFINSWGDATSTIKGYLELREPSKTTGPLVYKVTAVTDNSGWTELVVSFVAGTATFANSGILALMFFRSGDTGLDAAAYVASVNGQTGTAVLNADHIDDSTTTHRFTTAADVTKLAGIEAGADVTNQSSVEAANGVTAVVNFGADNRVVKSDSTNRRVQTTGLVVDDSNNLSGVVNIALTGTVDGRDLATDGSKLDHITVTQAVDLDQMESDIAALANGMVYSGDWDASSGSFPSGANTGSFYYVSVAGTVDSVSFSVGDNIVATTNNASTTTYSGNWSKHDQTDAVQSVVGLTGSITKSGLLAAINVEDGADVTDTANVTSAGALMDSELAGIAHVKALNQGVATTDNPQFVSIEIGDNSDTTLTRSSAGEVAVEGKRLLNTGDIGKQTIWVPASAMQAAATSGPAYGSTETTTNKINYITWNFDSSADEYAHFHAAMPKGWNEGTVSFIVHWTTTAVDTDGVAWGLQGASLSDNNTIDSAYGTAVVVTDSVQSAAGELLVTSESGPVTISGSPAEGDLCFFRLFRDVSDAADTMTEDAQLIGVQVLYTIDSLKDN